MSPSNPKNGNGLGPLTRVGNFIRLKRVKKNDSYHEYYLKYKLPVHYIHQSHKTRYAIKSWTPSMKRNKYYQIGYSTQASHFNQTLDPALNSTEKKIVICISENNVSTHYKVSFLKSLESSRGVLQLLKKNFYSVLRLHLLKPLFSVFRVLQFLSIFFFVLVNDLYTGDPIGSKSHTGNMHIPVRLCLEHTE